MKRIKRVAEKQITLTIDEQGLDFLTDIGFDPVYGARPLKRAIQRELENPLATALLSGDFAMGDTIVAEIVEGKFVFSK